MLRSTGRFIFSSYAGLPKTVWLLAAAFFVNRAGTMVMPFMTLYLTRERALSVHQAGQALGLYGLGAIAGAFLGGRLTETFGPIAVQIWSLSLTGLGFLIFSELKSPETIFPALFFLALITEVFRPAASTSVGLIAPIEERTRSYVLMRLAANLGMTVGPALGGLLAVLNYDFLFWADAATCWAAAAFLFVFLRPAFRGMAPLESESKIKTISPWQDGPFLAFCGLKLFQSAVFFQIMSTWPLYLRQHYGFAENAIGAFLGLNAAMVVLFEMMIVRVFGRFNRMRLIGLGALLICIGFGLIPYGNGPAFVAFTVVIWTCGEMLAMPLSMAIVADRAYGNRLGGYMAAISMTFSAAFVAAPLTGTAVYEKFGANALWHGIAVLGVFLFLGFWVLDESFKTGKGLRMNPEELRPLG